MAGQPDDRRLTDDIYFARHKGPDLLTNPTNHEMTIRRHQTIFVVLC